jgi:hypothetical protein
MPQVFPDGRRDRDRDDESWRGQGLTCNMAVADKRWRPRADISDECRGKRRRYGHVTRGMNAEENAAEGRQRGIREDSHYWNQAIGRVVS